MSSGFPYSLLLVCWVAVLAATAGANSLPPEAIAELQKLPDGKLSLQEVIRRAVRHSDSYRSYEADLLAADVARLSAEAPTDTRLVLGAGWQDDRREPQNPFMPNRVTASQFTAGLVTQLPTGTGINLELLHGLNDLRFSTIPSNRFAESRATLRVSQKLWKDLGGEAYRAGVAAARLTGDAQRARTREMKEKWFLDLANLYYESWTAQTLYQTARSSLERRERLLKTMRLRLQRGTAERPDLLQVESAVANDEVAVSQAKQSLADRWRLLLVALKLPASWASVDPALVPLTLDSAGEKSALESALAACGQPSTPAAVPAATALTEQARLLREAARLKLDKAKSEARPDLELSLGAGANSIDPSSGGTVSDLFGFRYPYLAAGIKLTIPLEGTAEEASRSQATADDLRAEATQAQAQDTMAIEWRNGCATLHRLKEAETTLERAVKWQRERERLEEERFRLGRSTTIQVIQAGDDETQAENRYRSAQTALRLAAWRVESMRGEVTKLLKAAEGE